MKLNMDRGVVSGGKRYARSLNLSTLLVLAASPGFSGLASASSFQGNVTNFSPSNGKVFVVVSGGFSGAATACANNSASLMMYWIDPATAYGRALMATALSAKLTDKLIYLQGDGTCTSGSVFGREGEALTTTDLKG